MILAIRTDSKDAYVGVLQDGREVTGYTWEAGRELSNQLLSKVKIICDKVDISIQGITGVVVYEGPGSYTGLRIGISVANSIAYSNKIPIAGSTGDNWIRTGINNIESIVNYTFISPQYGGQPHITKQKK